MPRRCNDNLSEDDPPPKKKNCNNSTMSSFDLKNGEYLKDITGKQWKLGRAVGVGGFGEIYLASDECSKEVKTDSKFVAKVESHKNGPLFVEMNCYLRIAKEAMIKEWKKEKKLTSLGMPHYVASGSHIHKGEKYRFLILPKFDKDLEKILQEKKMLNLKSVLTISLQIMDVLEYIHSKGYIHSDIKASNILLSNKTPEKKNHTPGVSSNLNLYNGIINIKHANNNPLRTCRMQKIPRLVRNLRPAANINYREDLPFNRFISFVGISDNEHEQHSDKKDQAYLLDFGLACKYLTSEGKHKPYCIDERKAHAGTILFCSRDAHKGVASRRSDLESLGYNMIYWLTGNLPWSGDADDPEVVEKKKLKVFTDIEYFLGSCFSEYPQFLEEYFKYLEKLEFQDKPDYNYCKKLFKQSLQTNGYKDDSCFDFDNTSIVQKQVKVKKKISENIKVRKIVHKVPRPPLQSNIPIKPVLRKKVKNKIKRKNNWFEDITDPEVIIKQAREKKNSENSDSNVISSNVANLNINILNPTYAMLEVYNKCLERIDASPSYRGDSYVENINGYTHAMISVLQKARKRKELEYEAMVVNLNPPKNVKTVKRCINKRKKKFESPAKSPPKTRTTKSVIVLVKKENLNFHGRKIKSGALRRTYSLRG